MRCGVVERDPETLWGPLLLLFTRVAREGCVVDDAIGGELLEALAKHDAVAPLLRLTAMALAADRADRRACERNYSPNLRVHS